MELYPPQKTEADLLGQPPNMRENVQTYLLMENGTNTKGLLQQIQKMLSVICYVMDCVNHVGL